MDQRHIYQPLHPEIRSLLDPQYVSFHDAHMQYVQPDDTKVWDGSARTRPSLPWGTLDPIPVGKVQDISIHTLDATSTFPVRVYTPSSAPLSASGWSIFVWFHGGGWAIGSHESESGFCTRVCQGANVIVCSVGYRLAPEFPFPAAADDAYAALKYFSSLEGASRVGADHRQIAVGGTSAGANLSCVATLRQIEALAISPLKLQVLIVPVIDNTATSSTVWKPNASTAPWLTPSRMTWYRRMYIRDESDWAHWHASPNFAPEHLLKKMPHTWIRVSERDILAPEGIAFTKQLLSLEVPVECQILEGCTHSILALDGVMVKGRKLVQDTIEAIKLAL